MIFINGQARRNLQEQVGYNAEQIERIFELLDGLNVQDNLIKLTTSSGTLDAQEMEVVSRDVAFILYNNNVYIKSSTSVSEFVFKQISLNASDQGTYNVLESYRIVITRASGAYSYATNTILSLYDKNKVDALLGAKANLSGATFTGNVNVGGTLAVSGSSSLHDLDADNITGDSIIETMSGYSYENGQSVASTTIEPIYAGIVKNGNKLTCVIASNVTQLSTASGITLGTFTIPTDVWNKLYPVEIGGYNYLVNSRAIAVQHSDFAKKDVNFVVIKASGSKIRIEFNNPALTQNEKSYLRIEVTFLLSSNLAS